MRLLALTAVSFAFAGCAAWGPSAPIAQNGASAPATSSAVRALRVRMPESVVVTAEDGDVPDGLRDELRDAVRTGLVNAGLVVVTEPAKPADLEATASAAIFSAAYLLRGSVRVALAADGQVVAELTSDTQLARRDRFAIDVAQALAARVGAAPGVLAFAVAGAVAHARQGRSLYELGRYREALGEYEAAYLAQPEPSLLFNIGQCHRLLGNRSDAARAYRAYLRNVPAAPNRPDIEKQIRDLEELRASR